MIEGSEMRDIFAAYARLNIGSAAVQEAIGKHWRYRAGAFELPPLPPIDPPVSVGRDEIVAAIGDVLQRLRSDEDLEEWANVIIMSDVYEVVGEERDVLLCIVHELASPSIYGALTEQKLRNLLAQMT